MVRNRSQARFPSQEHRSPFHTSLAFRSGSRTERTIFGGPLHAHVALPPCGQRLSNQPCQRRPPPQTAKVRQTAKGLPLAM